MRLLRPRGLTALALPATLVLAALLPVASVPAAPRGAAARYLPATGCPAGRPGGLCVRHGTASVLGRGRVLTYTEYTGTAPRTLGVVLTRGAVTGLPTTPTDGEHCHDSNGDGRRHPWRECVGGHGLELALPPAGPADTRLPFQWVLFNWNPQGHSPHGRYDVPHFDAHFYLAPRRVREGIRLGSCALLIDCRQLPAASAPVPAAHLPRGYPASTPETAEGAMGMHLDSRPPDVGPLSGHTLIYGAHQGRIIFLEPMLTRDFLLARRTGSPRRVCAPVAQPPAWRTPGPYPTRYCVAHRPRHDDFTITLTGFTTPAGPGPRAAPGSTGAFPWNGAAPTTGGGVAR
ncbi:hypothetical protein [Streptomyces sp. NPDC050856]|uniref:hypothetical protein n=1 Tax=Streptomyces sp. NPDC050856 TaxID=3154939 RepID=UPI0033C35F9C